MYNILLAIEFCYFLYPISWEEVFLLNVTLAVFFFFCADKYLQEFSCLWKTKDENLRVLPCKLLLSVFFQNTQGTGSSAAGLLHVK